MRFNAPGAADAIADAAKFVKFDRPTSFPVIRYGDV